MINGKIIAIDARMIEMSGIGTYIQHIMGHEIYDYALGREEEIRKYDKKVKIISFDAPIYSLGEQLTFPNKEVKRAQIELIHFPHYNVPICYRGNFVVTIHDLTHIVFPEFLGNRIKYEYAKFLMKHAAKKAKHIFTVSKHSKKDISSIFGVKEDKISITYNAVGKEFEEKNKEDYQYLYDKYKISGDKTILLYVGNLKPHKNLSRLLKAFAGMNNKNEYRLILVGKAFAGMQLENDEKEMGIRDFVIHTGSVEKTELIDLYNLADLFVFPSLYEGFGIPPLEAMACGTPVICSDNSSIPEVVGEAAVMFDAMDVEDIREKIISTVRDKELCNRLIDEGFKRMKIFDWNNTVETVRSEIQKIK